MYVCRSNKLNFVNHLQNNFNQLLLKIIFIINIFLGLGDSELLLDSEPFFIKKYQEKSTFIVTFFLNSLEFEGLAYLII